MSYRLAQLLLRDAFPGGKSLPSSSIKAKIRAVGECLEYEAAVATAVAADERSAAKDQPGAGPRLALQIDAGYIRTSCKASPGAWMPVVASKLVPPTRHRSFAHAYVPSLVARQGVRQQAFLRSLQVPASATITVLSDGGDDISLACKLPCAAERVLDWFHIGMYFERLLKAIPGLKGADILTKEQMQRKVVAAKRLLWHGRKNHCLAALEALRRDTGWVGARNPLGRVIRYLRACASLLVNYAARRRKGQPISSAGAESAVDFVIGQSMKRNGHMRWTPVGANAILQVRCAVLNGLDMRNFKRWYPPGARLAWLQAPAAPSYGKPPALAAPHDSGLETLLGSQIYKARQRTHILQVPVTTVVQDDAAVLGAEVVAAAGVIAVGVPGPSGSRLVAWKVLPVARLSPIKGPVHVAQLIL